MTNQVFKKNGPPLSIFLKFIDVITLHRTDAFFLITNDSYKKACYEKCLHNFVDELKPYYKSNKLLYIDRQMNYKRLLTVIRQLCNFHNIVYSSEIRYDKSTYQIRYKLYIQPDILNAAN